MATTTLTTEMVIDPKLITKEVKQELFSGCDKKYKYAVIFLHNWTDEGFTTDDSYITPKRVHYNNGIVKDPCVNYYQTKEEAEHFIKLIPNITNRNYTNASVISRS